MNAKPFEASAPDTDDIIIAIGEYEKSGKPLPPLAELVWGGPELPRPVGQIDLLRAIRLLCRFGFSLEAEVRVSVPGGGPEPVVVGTLDTSVRRLGRAVAELVAGVRGVPPEKLPQDWQRGVVLTVSQTSTVSVTL